MLPDSLSPLARGDLKRHFLAAMHRYWPDNAEPISELPVPGRPFPEVVGSLHLSLVEMPEWALPFAVDGALAVPQEACGEETVKWENVDWFLAGFLLLECWHERQWEMRFGPIHSYSTRLTRWDRRVWDKAWVNRIALFLRAWAARRARQAGVWFLSLSALQSAWLDR